MIVKLLLSFFLAYTLSWAGNVIPQIDKLNQKIPYASKSETKAILHQLENLYISAVISGKKESIAKSLRGIIRCQKLLGIDASTYQKELQNLTGTKLSHKETKRPPHLHPVQTKKKKRMIRSISSHDNSLIVKFDQPITKKDVFFFQVQKPKHYKHIYDIRANLNFQIPKLDIDALKHIKIAQNRKDKVRIVLVNDSKISSKAYIRKGTLFIQIKRLNKTIPTPKTKTKVKKPVVPVKTEHKTIKKGSATKVYASSKTIVIDAGHGGHDSGAVGYKKYQEKKCVLKVATLLKSMLRKKGFKVYMTRHNDTFIKLTKRTHIANLKEADLFISIHANAAPKGKYISLKGIETFFLSPAKTKKAKRIAAKENAAASAMNSRSKETLLSFLNRNKIIQSNKLAIDIQSGLLHSTRQKFKHVKDGGVREAPFWVLVGAQMPAVLVELGYITNPTEGERLFNPFYQKALAKGIYQGINSYFSHNK